MKPWSSSSLSTLNHEHQKKWQRELEASEGVEKQTRKSPSLNFRKNEETENPKIAKTTKPKYFFLTGIRIFLNCRYHPFFKDISRTIEEQKCFYNRLFATEGDIFKRFVFD